ncbi:MAG: U32 family peptidase [Planctomycetes bacterium]|nr:U32 family peptidase [Planctomycetota bacterium]
MRRKVLLNAPAGNLPSLIAAVAAGADSIYIGFRSPTNLRNLPGLNFSLEEAAEGVRFAHSRNVEVYVTVNTYPLDPQLAACLEAVDDAADIGADGVIAADWAVLDHAKARHPRLGLHLSCVAGAADAEAIRFYAQAFGVTNVILPRVLTLSQIAALRAQTDVALEVLAFGVLCANYDGRCCLSSFITGRSAHSAGACAPAELVELAEQVGRPVAISGACLTARALGRERDGCGTCCRRYPDGMVLEAGAQPIFRIEGPQTLSAQTWCLVEHLGALARAGVDTVRVLPQLSHTGRIVRLYREVLDHCRACSDALGELRALSPEQLCNGWLLGKAGWVYESSN